MTRGENEPETGVEELQEVLGFVSRLIQKNGIFPAGSFAFLDPDMRHYAMAAGDVIVQGHGNAPLRSVQKDSALILRSLFRRFAWLANNQPDDELAKCPTYPELVFQKCVHLLPFSTRRLRS